MAFQNLTKNPEESTVIISILGLLFADGLNAIDTGVLGRFFIYLGEVLVTISAFAVAHEAEAIEENKITTVGKEDTVKTDGDNTLVIISELQQQNQYLQEQIWALQETLSNIQNKR